MVEHCVDVEKKALGVDVANVAEEIESLGRAERHEIKSRLAQIGLHLLKQQYQPERATPSWANTIFEQADEIQARLEESPSLQREMPAFMAAAYPRARRKAQRETGLPAATFPKTPTPEFEAALAAALAAAIGEDD